MLFIKLINVMHGDNKIVLQSLLLYVIITVLLLEYPLIDIKYHYHILSIK